VEWRRGPVISPHEDVWQRNMPISRRSPDDLVSRLEALCRTEPAGNLSMPLPARHAEYLDVLSTHAPVDRVWAGPVYMSTRELAPSAAAIAIEDENVHLHGYYRE
jgi:hypothetical protein